MLKEQSVALMFTPQLGGVGYGWIVGRRLNRRVYRMSGRSPGFSSEIEHYPDEDLLVMVLSNNYAATATTIATDLAAMVLGEPVVPLAVRSNPRRSTGHVVEFRRGGGAGTPIRLYLSRPAALVPVRFGTSSADSGRLIYQSGGKDYVARRVP